MDRVRDLRWKKESSNHLQVDSQDVGDVSGGDIGLFEGLTEDGGVAVGVRDPGILDGAHQQVRHDRQQLLFGLAVVEQRPLQRVDRR